MKTSDTKISFFRQSGWMIVATVLGGVFMAGVQVLASKKMDGAEYGVFFSLLRYFVILSIPAAGLQTVFAQQAAAAISDSQVRQLTYTTRRVLLWILLGWLGMVGLTWLAQDAILSLLRIRNSMGLWMTLLLVLGQLWLPVIRGLLQGHQQFLSLGWVLITDGVGRCTSVFVIVFFLGGQAAGGMTGAVLGVSIAMMIGFILIRRQFHGASEPYSWRPWFGKIIPYTLGTGALCVIQNADVLFVQSVFPDQPFMPSKRYMPAVLVGWGLVQFTVPLASVMFPKIVRSHARSEKSDALKLTLLGTLALGLAAAVASTLFPQLPLRIIYFFSPEYWQAAPLVPWFAWALLPLTLVYVLVNNLLARDRFEIVPWLMLAATLYFTALATWGNSFLAVVQILGLCNLGVFMLAVVFTMKMNRSLSTPSL